MANYSLIQLKIDRGIAHAGKALGQPFSVYRATLMNSNGDFPDGWQLLTTGLHLYRDRIAAPKLETGIQNATLFYDVYADMSNYQLGDVFVCTDPPLSPGASYGAGATILASTDEINALALCWHMPGRVPTGARLNRLARIYRPATTPAPMTDGSRYWKTTLDNDQQLVLQSGVFGFAARGNGNPAFVPVGLMVAYRPSGTLPFQPPPPGMIRPTHWFCYIPPLFSYEPREGDAIVTDDDARYIIVDAFKQESGVVGTQCMMDRTAAPVG